MIDGESPSIINWRWITNRNFLDSLQKGRSTKGNWTTLWSEGKLKHRNILSFQKPGLQNIFWMTNDNSQLAMLRGQVCSSKGKRARYMGQVQIKDTLQQSTRWEMKMKTLALEVESDALLKPRCPSPPPPPTLYWVPRTETEMDGFPKCFSLSRKEEENAE